MKKKDCFLNQTIPNYQAISIHKYFFQFIPSIFLVTSFFIITGNARI